MTKVEQAVELLAVQNGICEAELFELLKGNLQAGVSVCHQLAKNAGWWSDLLSGEPIERDMGEVFTLIHSEISEGFEGYRKNLMDDKLPHRRMPEVEIADTYIRIFDACGGFEWNAPDEMIANYANYRSLTDGGLFSGAHMSISDAYRATIKADREQRTSALGMAMCKLWTLAKRHDMDIYGAIVEKLAFNVTRADHQREHRLAEGGKKC